LTPNPLLGDEDQLELVEESGLLVLDPDGSDAQNAIEVSSRFLIDDEENEVIVKGPSPTPTQDVEEIASEYLAFVEAQGEIARVDLPSRPISDSPSVDIAGLHNEALSNDSAQYSDGVPVYRRRSHGISSKTLRVPAPKSGTSWVRKMAIASVFAAGIGVGVGFALTQNETASVPATASETAEAGASETAVPAPAAILVPSVEPIVEPLNVEEATRALAGDEDSEVEADLAEVEAEAEAEAEATDTEAAPEAFELEMGDVEESVSVEPERKKSARKERSSGRVKNAVNAAPTPAAADPGVLMLAAKPPSQIRIDGKTTGLTTPQRVLRLSPGKHRITLINREHKIRDSFKVSIVSGQKTRIVRDNTSKIK
jgi:pyruvate/2-oxoglutarate dehydrogenase complex dihydrolipoamide acyltransferase (E2) component